MALIICPDCRSRISDRAERCPHCGLPAQYFRDGEPTQSISTNENKKLDYSNLGNILLSFDKDYCTLFGASHYITHREEDHMNEMYKEYYKTLCNKMIFQYVCNNARTFRVDIDSLKSFLSKMHTLNRDITTHNTNNSITLKTIFNTINKIFMTIMKRIKLNNQTNRFQKHHLKI